MSRSCTLSEAAYTVRMSKHPRKKSGKSSTKKQRGGRSWQVKLLLFLFKCLLVLSPVIVLGSIYMDSQVRGKFEGRKWAIPAKIYARPLEIYPGQTLSLSDFTNTLELLGYQRSDAVGRAGQFAATANEVRVFTRGFPFADQRELSQQLHIQFTGNRLNTIQTANGQNSTLIRLEPLLIGSIFPGEHEDRLLIRLEETPPVMLAGLVAVEDRYYMQHHGFSIRGVVRALWMDIMAGSMVQGGSTITQQLVKNFYLSSERTLSRKVQEVWMALLLEYHYDKRAILEAYLNEVYLGQEGNRAIHGFGLASQYYFRQPLSELKLQQMALLIGMVKGPSYYDPWRHKERSLGRRKVVLDVMLEQGIISSAERDWAHAQPLGVGQNANSKPGVYPAFLDMVRRQLKSDYRDEDLLSEGLQVFTTIDPQIQRLAETQLANGIDKLEKANKKIAAKALQGAVVITSPGNGEVLALVGDRNPQYIGFNRALDARRPVGSLLKPFVFLAALESQRYSLATQVDDGPVRWQTANKTYWQPQNYDHKDHGQVAVIDALTHSYNQVTARIGLQVGVKRLVEIIRRAGVNAPIEEVPSLILGAGGMTPVEVAELYQVIPAVGFTLPLRSIREVYTAEGKALKRYGLDMEQRFDPAHIQLISFAMESVIREGTAKAAYDAFPFGIHLAGKTGTTDDQRDSWFGGFSVNYNTVVWVGQDNNGKTPLTGATGALPIWTSIMSKLPNESLPQPTDTNIEWQWIDRSSGARTDDSCTGARRLPIDKRGTQATFVPCNGKATWLPDFLRH